MTEIITPSLEHYDVDTSTDIRTALWMEHGFSRREIGALMLEADADLEILSSERQPLTGTLALPFPIAKTPDAIETINRTAEQHGIDAIWVQNSALYDLSGIVPRVHAAATPDVIRLVDDKIAFTQWLGNDPHRPDATLTIGSEQVAKEYYRRSANGQEVCIKPVVGVNGGGYWRLNPHANASFLNDPTEREIHPEVYFTALAKAEQEAPARQMIVMDYLPGPEVSVDVLSWEGRPLSHAARTKVKGTQEFQHIDSEHPTIGHAYRTIGSLSMHGIVSVQYRLDAESDWKILEINPRPAGGSIHSERAGFGIISGWTKLVTGKVSPDDIKQHNGHTVLEMKRTAHVVSER